MIIAKAGREYVGLETKEAVITEIIEYDPNGIFGPFHKVKINVDNATVFIYEGKIKEPFVGQKIMVFLNENGYWKLSNDTVDTTVKKDAVVNGVLRKELHDVMEEWKILVDAYDVDPVAAAILVTNTK